MLSVLGYVFKPFTQPSEQSDNDRPPSENLPNMDDDSESALDVERQDFQYENCIVTHHDDSNDSFTSLLSSAGYDSPSTSQQSNESDLHGVTCEQVLEADLSPEDSFYFMLGMVNRVQDYLGNLSEDRHKEWLSEHVYMIKTVLMKNWNVFNKSEFTINKTTVKTKTPKVRKSANKNKQKRVEVTRWPKSRLQGELYESPGREGDSVNHVDTIGAKSSVRRSVRLQDFAKDRELVYCDRMSYISLKLPSSTPVPQIVKRKVRGKIEISKFFSTTSPIKEKRTRKTKSLGAETIKAQIKNEKNRNAKLQSNQKNNSLRKYGRKSWSKKADASEVKKKRRGVSLDRGMNKKVKKSAEMVTTDSLQGTSLVNLTSTSSSGTRKLYSADNWLHDFTIMQQASPSS